MNENIPEKNPPRRSDFERNPAPNVNEKSAGQNDPNQGYQKMTAQNQLYKPTQHLLAWDEPAPVQNKPNTRQREGVCLFVIVT